jgi:hypothetical protein
MTGFWLTFSNRGGELDRIFAATEAEATEKLREALTVEWSLQEGDTIRIVAGESDHVRP